MEVNFARGGTLPVKKTKKKIEENFGAKNVDVEKQKQKHGSKRERIKKAKSERSENDAQEITSANSLTLHTLAADMLVIGVVKSIYSTHLDISLPGRLVGKLQANHISASYSNLLLTFLENQELASKPKTLAEMFTEGQIIYAKVIDKCHGEKQEVLLSLLPADLHSDISSSSWAEGNVLMCAVQEEEDHGYLMESGIKNFQAFLPKKNVKTSPAKGELMFCKIEKISSTTVTLAAFKKNEQVKIDTIDVPNIKTLVPGSVITFTVARIMKDGLEGLIFDGSVSAYVNELYLPAKVSMSDSQILGKEYKARILYTTPLSNQLFVTLIVDEPAKTKAQITFGTLVENAKVVKQMSGSGGILLKLNDKNVGFLPRRAIVKNLKNNFDIDSLLIKFSVNTSHTVRVMDFSSLENCYLCTNDKKLLDEKIFGTYNLEIGQVHLGKVVEKLSDGYRLKIGNVRAFLKGIFLNKSAKINVGDSVRVRIVEIDHALKCVQVTNLNGFLKDTAKFLHSKAKMKFNESFAGVVLREGAKGFIILFFNHIKGFLPKSPETEAAIISLGGLKVGSVQLFSVKTVKGDKLTLSIPKKVSTENLGKVFEAKVTAVLPSGLQIKIPDLNVFGKVSESFLSEFPSLAKQILSNIKENDKIEVVALGNNQYSRRDVTYYRNGGITDFNDVNPGDVLRCYVTSTDVETVELECPLKNFNDTIKLNRNAFDIPAELILNSDDIVYVSVIAKTESHQNSLYVTPSLHKVLRNEMDLSLGMIQSYLADIRFLREKLRSSGKPLGKFFVGQRVSGTVKNIIGNNLLIEIAEGLFAQGTVDNVQSYKIGGAIKDAVIVWLDPVTQMIHLTLKDKCREEISVNQKADPKMVSNKKHKAIIAYFNDFVTVCTIRKSGQPLIYVPSKFHYNDFSPVQNRALGNATSKLTIKKEADGNLLGVFVQDYKIFRKIEKLKTKLDTTLGKRKHEESIETEAKKPKVILDASDEEEETERKTETDESEDEKPKPVPQQTTKQQKTKGKKFMKSLKGTLKKRPSIPKKIVSNKDSLLNNDLVKLVSFKSIKEGEGHTGKKPAKVFIKSSIGKKTKPKRLVKRT